jgi:outer membrane protein OmpA-like peptidoglycan-associated protein
MRIIIPGFALFVIWCFISAWLYNDKLLPVINAPVTEVTIPEPKSGEADSLSKIKASLPTDLRIYFEFNNSEFNPDPQTDSSIAAFKTWLDKYPGSMLSVIGYSDLVGTSDFNKALGLKRAQAISEYLENKGIDGARMNTDSEGEEKPAADYLTSEGRAKNRRTVISIKM